MKIIAYLKEKHLLHPGRTKKSDTKSEKARKRKKMKEYWLYKDTSFDEYYSFPRSANKDH